MQIENGILEFPIEHIDSGYGYAYVNKDGKVNALDIRDLKRYTGKWTGYDETKVDVVASDVNADNKVNALDVRDLKRHTGKWTGYETLPIKK